MNQSAYLALNRKAARAHDAEVAKTLTGLPHWIEEWGEYAAADSTGRPITGETSRECSQQLEFTNDIIRKHAQGA